MVKGSLLVLSLAAQASRALQPTKSVNGIYARSPPATSAVILSSEKGDGVEYSRRGWLARGGSTAASSWLVFPGLSDAVEANGVGDAVPLTVEEQLRVFQTEQTAAQKKRLEIEEQNELRRDSVTKDLIAKGVISLPSNFPDATVLFPEAFDTINATIFVSVFARTGPPVAALRIPLKQKGGIVQFPLAFEVTSRDLLFPLTPEAWITDARNKGEMGIAATIDSDGKIATGDTKDLIGFGISKPVPIGGVLEMTSPTIELDVRTKFRGYSPDQVVLLDRIDGQFATRSYESVDSLALKQTGKVPEEKSATLKKKKLKAAR